MKEYITVAEAAKELNVTKQAVYQRLEKDLKPHVKTLNGQKVVSSKAIRSIVTDKPEEIQDETSRLKQETIDALKDTIGILKEQLEKKDNQIELLNERLKEASQRLSEANSIAFKQIEFKPSSEQVNDNTVEDESAATIVEVKEDKQGFFKRMFKK